MSSELSRRGFVRSTLAFLATGLAGAASGATRGASGKSEQAEVTPNEDLMREHGALRRLLLVYEEIARRAGTGALPRAQLAAASGLIRHFVEDYHEKLEENYIFPAFEKAKRLTDLTSVLRAQHQAGRAITAQLQTLAGSTGQEASEDTQVRTLIAAFLRMYRPHAAREDTVLFPAFPRVVGAARYRELGDVFEGRERQLFGQNGFGHIVGQVQSIEEQLGIYSLAQFTPKT